MDANERGVLEDISAAILALLRGERPSPVQVPLDTDEDLRALSETVNNLLQSMGETDDFVHALARGELETDVPVGNLLISPFKDLHSTLRHLTWQTEQISKGYLGQQVDFLGDFSRAFNAMLASMRAKKQAEDALRESESTLQTVLRTAPIGIGLAKNRVLRWVNEAFCEITGYSPEELAGKSIRMLYESDEEFERVGHERIAQLKDHGRTRIETKWKCRNGHMIDVLVCSSFPAPGGPDAQAVFAVVDVTENKRAQQIIENQMHFLETMLEAIPSPVFYKDVSGVYLGCNTAYAQFVGAGKEKIVWSKAHDIAPADLADMYTEKDRQALDNPGVQVYEAAVRRPDGTVMHSIVHKGSFTDRRGRQAGIIGVILDITERKRIEQALEESEKRYRELVENASEGILVAQEGMIVFANRRCAELAGMSEEALESTPFAQFVHPDDLEMVADFHMRRTRGDNTPLSYSLRLCTQPGIIKWIRMNSALISWKGRPATLGLVTDITEQKRAESRQKELMEEIKHFTYIVSHDLRAPLTNLRGFCGELAGAVEVLRPVVEHALVGLSEKGKSLVEVALREDIPEALLFTESALSRMDRLVNSILELSRLGRRALHPELVDMNQLTVEVINSFAHEIDTAAVRVLIGPLPSVHADRVSMEQIMSNLIGNALKFRDPDRPGEITITGYRYPHETVLLVEDNGLGIDEADLERVFEIFQRAGTADVPGEGMGLAYVRTLVRRHGGRIWCTSAQGVGSSFRFSIADHRSEDENLP